MKKLMFVLTALCLLSFLCGQCLAYNVSGTVYQKGTTIAVPGASVRITSPNASYMTTADKFGSFSMGWAASDEIGNQITLTASKGSLAGRKSWKASQNTEYKNVEVVSMIAIDPSLVVNTEPMQAIDPAMTTVISPATLQSYGGPVQVQNAQINMAFNGPIIGVADVVPVVPVTSLTWDMPTPGQLVVNVELASPLELPGPDFPAESFFDVYYEVEIPESDVMLAKVTVENAIFNLDGGAELFGIPGETENLFGDPEPCKPNFLIDNQLEWQEALDGIWPDPGIIPMSPAEWNHPEWGYMKQWEDHLEEGDSYPPTEFLPPELYVYPGDNSSTLPDPDDAGLVMTWGDDTTLNGDYASAWKYDYGLDPDLTNCIITVTATPPPGILNISLGLQDINGNIRSWHWTCGPTGVLPSGTPTIIKIDTTVSGLNAANPVASGYASNPAFDITKVQYIIADENSNWVAQQGAVPPGGQIQAIWNYWHNLKVLKKTDGAYKGNYVKYSQPPVEVEDGLIDGWDQFSQYHYDAQTGVTFSMAADDWVCKDNRPVTDLHWWGSFIGWTQPFLPPQVPDYFKICIWKDVPQNVAGPDGVVTPYSRPSVLVWEHDCYKWVWNYAAYDLDPRWNYNDLAEYDRDKLGNPQENESCFQFNQLLSEDEWFHQEPMEDGLPNIYWISIAAVYLDKLPSDIQYPWGWKTRPYDPALAPDVAGVITDVDVFPFKVNFTMVNGFFPLVLPDPDQYPGEKQYDLAFELTTNKDDPNPGFGSADLNHNNWVDLADFAIFAQQWLTPGL